MDYSKLYHNIIERSKVRTYDSKIHHNHHIIPKHVDKTSTEVVPLTIKEHAIAHLLLYKMYGIIYDKCAYGLLRKEANNELTPKEYRRQRAILGGLSVWAQGKGSGVCSPKWRDQNNFDAIANASTGGKIGGKVVGSMLWWNNGIKNVKAFTCPNGFQRGMLQSEKKKRANLKNIKRCNNILNERGREKESSVIVLPEYKGNKNE